MKMIRRKIEAIAFALSVSILNVPAQVYERPINQQEKEKYLKDILSLNVLERRQAASRLRYISTKEIDPRLMGRIVELLRNEENRLENAQKERGYPKGTLFGDIFGGGEEGATYILDLCELVGKSGDLGILPILIEHETRPDFLTGYGEETAVLFFKEIDNARGKPRHLSYFLRVFGFWLDDNKKDGFNAKGDIRNRIKTELLKWVYPGTESVARTAAALALSKAQDNDLIPVFEKIAAMDPLHTEEGREGPTDRAPAPGVKVLRYPIREIAKSWLEKRRK